MPQMLSPKLTASWEKGLTGVAEGAISEEEYMQKLKGFVTQMVDRAKAEDNRGRLNSYYRMAAPNYKSKGKSAKGKKKAEKK